MAVEARHLHFFPPQVLTSGNLMMNNGVEFNGNVYGTPMTYGVMTPLLGISTATDTTVVPMYSSASLSTVTPKSAAMKSDNDITYAKPVSRKRSRDQVCPLLSTFTDDLPNQSANHRSGFFTFLGEDISSQIQLQQMEIDLIISQHTEKVMLEMEEKRGRFSMRFAAAVHEKIIKKLKAKDEEIEKIEKLNYVLEEKVKSLYVENQIWRDLAQTNEATANALKCDLEQVLTHVEDEQQQQQMQRRRADAAALQDDARSCCGSNYEEIDTPALADNASTDTAHAHYRDKHDGINSVNRLCRSCGEEESCVLLLPCRHLCLCSICGSFVHTCPVCSSVKTASLHVNLSS